MPTLADVVAVLDALYDPATAASWDAVGLVLGDPGADVRRVLLAVDPVDPVVDEAVAWGADLLLTHHPLFLRGVHGFAATTPKGRRAHRMTAAGIALYTAHTNADVARPGVSDALAAVLGLDATVPLRPLDEDRGGTASLARGLGRVGDLAEPETFEDFARRVAAALPPTPVGVRAAGDPLRMVRRVAVSGGAGDDLFDDARAHQADVLVTADLRHHPALESLERGAPMLVDPGHWASEWPWLAAAAQRLADALAGRGTTVEIRVSSLVTDPWTLHTPGSPR